jgi:hypothetical protein
VNIWSLIKQSWRITFGHWRLWLLLAAMLAAFLPAALVGGSFGTLTSVLTLPLPAELSALFAPMLGLPPALWWSGAAAGLVLVVLSTAASCVLQAAAMRAAAACADGTFQGLRQALQLGRERLITILKLSVLYGVLVAALALIPPMLLLAVGDESFVRQVSASLFTNLAPLNSLLSVGILLVLISVALEDVRAEAALGRTWTVFKAGWKEFAVVIGISLGTGILQAVMLVPLLVLVGVSLAMGDGWMLVLLCAGVTVPLVLAAWLSTGVFTLVLYTLVYRSAAQTRPVEELGFQQT